MSDAPKDVRLEVVVGAASPPAVTLRAGEPRDVFSVGFEGSWSVAAEGIAAVHAYFVFDGASLFVASADAARPALMDGAAVPVEWVTVPVPGEVLLGRGVLRTRVTSARAMAAPPPPRRADDRERTQQVERTMALAPPAQPPRPAPPRERSTEDSSRTRIAPVEAMERHAQVGASPGGQLAAAQGAPFAGAPPGFGAASAQGTAPAFGGAEASGPAPMYGAPPPRSPAGPRIEVPAFWLKASLPKKITYVLLPFALLATLYVILADDEPVATRAPAPRASSSAPATTAPLPATPPTAPPTATPAAPTDSAPVASATHVGPPPRGTLPAGKRTPDREVVDLIAAGSYADAARRLDDLAAAHADHPEYREAARILRAKAGQPGHMN